jgi:hypothetical protein
VGEWTDIKRDGEPELVDSGDHGSTQFQHEYHIRTTPIPAGPKGDNWVQLFTSQFTGDRTMSGYHDRQTIAIVYCPPDDEPKLAETVDAAIAYANTRLQSM